MRDRDYQYLAALWLVIKSVELLPVFVLGESFERSETFMLFLLDYNVFFPLMGHYLEKRLDGRHFTARGAALASLAALFSLALMCLATERWCRAQGQWPAYAGELTFGALNYVIALALFYIAKTAFLRRSVPAWAARTMTLFGSCSFGLYLLQHYFLRWVLLLHALDRGINQHRQGDQVDDAERADRPVRQRGAGQARDAQDQRRRPHQHKADSEHAVDPLDEEIESDYFFIFELPGDAELVLSGDGYSDAGSWTFDPEPRFREGNEDNYDITYVYNSLEIQPAELTITASASKEFDGEPLDGAEAVEIEGLVGYDEIIVTATGTITDAGTADNPYTIDWGDTR